MNTDTNPGRRFMSCPMPKSTQQMQAFHLDRSAINPRTLLVMKPYEGSNLCIFGTYGSLQAQADFLYDKEWTSVIDNMFIEYLANEAKLGDFRVGGVSTDTLEVLRWIINNRFDASFTLEQIYGKINLFHKRYRVFELVAHTNGIHYDMRTNTIIGAPFVWDYICREHPFVHAYMTEGDPNWQDLCAIFGKDDELIEMNPNVEMNPNHIIDIPSDDSGDENLEHPLPQIINKSSNDGLRLDNSFWNELMEGYAFDSFDDVPSPPMGLYQFSLAAVEALPPEVQLHNFG
ncbi:hypothetical protein BUALT_Bualt08G0024500 [Buddleja alternifolia]|uniref:Myb/SANT-like domain-containing protein n=1 Tax=Buddleja alternifolia TaxID=168488 RepID=A0AAV6XDY8_9LAMI|nr:hypothetical protein BUALT_Bualt08G0024500 [Buddleja alternifolia]